MNKKYLYPIIIKETYLDLFGHVNNAMYLTLFEEARWDFITKNGYGLQKIQETGEGPMLLDIQLKFIKEIRTRDEIVIESSLLSYEKKIGKLSQEMNRKGEICCTVTMTFGLFSLKERKLILPTPAWLKAMGLD